MKCPHCGAELQENARFCLYCMQSLQEKTDVSAPATKKLGWRSRLLLSLLAVGVLVSVIYAIGKRAANVPEESSQLENTSTEASTSPTAAAETKKPITDSNQFYFDAINVTNSKACQGLWEPSGFYLLERDGDMEEYRAPVYLQNAGLEICFIHGGAEILTAVTNLTQDTLNDGVKLADCIAAAIYYSVDCEVPDLTQAIPSEPVAAGDSCMARLHIDDPAAMRIDAGTQANISRASFDLEVNTIWGKAHLRLIYELRTRICEGIAYYDIFLFCQ